MNNKNADLMLIEIGKRAKSLRVEKGLTREKLAELAGISSETIKRVENGDNYSMNTFLKLVSGLETSADLLCSGKKDGNIYEFIVSLYEHSKPDEFLDILKKLK